MSAPLPPGLEPLEQALERTVASPSAALRERILAAALEMRVSFDPGVALHRGAAPGRAAPHDGPAARRSRFARRADPRWLAASAAAALLLLFNLTRSAAHAGPRGAPSRALCAALLDAPGAAATPFTAELLRACPSQASAPAEESP